MICACLPERLNGCVLPNCHAELPRSVRSILANNTLNGTIPTSLGSLTALKQLCVPAYDAAASYYCHCAELRWPACVRSSLSGNQLSGSIPSSLGNLTQLMYLCVPRGRTGACRSRAMLMKCPACVCSWIADTQLSGSIPSSLGNLTQLLYLCVPRERRSRCAVPACSAKALCLCSQLSLQQHAQRYHSVQLGQSDFAD